jgi:large repetitive protein
VNFESQFTTAAAVDTRQPQVANQRPGNGATGVPLNTSVVLYMSEPMNATSLQGAVHISQNGIPVTGTSQVTAGGQVIQFTPTPAWQPHALIQVFLDSTATDLAGNTAVSYQGSFTAVVDPGTTAPAVLNTNPASGVSGVPTNVVIGVQFNQTLNPATVNTTNVQCTQSGSIPITVNLVGGGTIIQILPTAVLAPNTSTQCQIGSGVQGANGLTFPGTAPFFTTGAGTDTTAPTMLSASPLNSLTNIGDNSDVDIVFSEPINPLTISGSTIQLSGGGITEVPDSISIGNNNSQVLMVPHVPLPDSTLMTLTISGVTDLAGNALVPQTTHFTTGIGPTLASPAITSTNPFDQATNVALNAQVQVHVDHPLDPGLQLLEQRIDPPKPLLRFALPGAAPSLMPFGPYTKYIAATLPFPRETGCCWRKIAITPTMSISSVALPRGLCAKSFQIGNFPQTESSTSKPSSQTAAKKGPEFTTQCTK